MVAVLTGVLLALLGRGVAAWGVGCLERAAGME